MGRYKSELTEVYYTRLSKKNHEWMERLRLRAGYANRSKFLDDLIKFLKVTVRWGGDGPEIVEKDCRL